MRFYAGLCVAMACLAWSPMAAQALVIDLGGSGWEAVIDDADASVIDIVVDAVTPEAVIIEIAKEFTEGPDPGTGEFPPLDVLFVQIAEDVDTVPYIVIEDETVINSTGFDWTDYHFEIIGGGETAFDADRSSDFATGPFQTRVYSDDFKALWLFDGLVAPDEIFYPGFGSGALWIAADLSDAEPVSFVFRQMPTPEPATLVTLLAGAGLVLLRRRW